jgi:hypothetical protein
MYGIFDPKDLSDEEIAAKRAGLNKHIADYRNTQYQHLVHSMEITLAVLEEEYEYRQLKKMEEISANAAKPSKHDKRKKQSAKTQKNPNVINVGFIKGVDDV